MFTHRRWALRTLLGCGCACALFVACSDDNPGDSGSGAGNVSASSTTSSAMSSSSSSGGGGGARPIVCSQPTVQTEPPSTVQGECDVLQQDCQLGRTCVPAQNPRTREWSTRCVIGPGLKGPGKPCVSADECEAGLFCIGGRDGYCSAPCCAPTSEPCGNGLCNQFTDFGNGLFVWMCSYDERCELFTEDACDEGRDCHISDTRQGLASCTRPAQPLVEEGQSCNFLNQCGDMQHCDALRQGGSGLCRYYCYLQPSEPMPSGRGGCPEGQACQQVNLGRGDIGLCRPQ